MKKNIFLWTGEKFLIDEKIFQWEKVFLEKHWEMNFEKIILPGERFSKIFDAILAPPFLAEKRLVVIKWLPYSSDVKKNEKFTDEEIEEILNILPEIQEDTIIVFTSWNPDKRWRFFKQLKNLADFEEFKNPDKKIFEWVKNFCERKKILISDKNIQFLLNLTGKNLYNITNELKKLKNFSEWKEISEDDIKKCVLDNSETNIFKITSLISAWKKNEAYFELQHLLRWGEDIFYIFNLIIRQFRLLIACFELKNLPSAEIWKILWVAPFVASTLKNQVWKFSIEDLLEKNRKCYEIDKNVKIWKISWAEMLALVIEREFIFW